jgi:hypothetical protein
VLSTDANSTTQQAMYRSNGILRPNSNNWSVGSAPARVTINGGDFAELQSSDFQVADVIFFDRRLDWYEYAAVEVFLSSTYKVCLRNCDPPLLDTSPLPEVLVGDWYGHRFSVNGGENSVDDENYSPESPSYALTSTRAVFSLASGTLPSGMSLLPNGWLSGDAGESGSFTFEVSVTDIQTGLTDTQQFSLNVQAPSNAVADERFLQGNYVEFGIGGNGHFGSTGSAPSGYHPRGGGGGDGPGGDGYDDRIGFVSDRNKDGWGVGQDDGDFFVPGIPFEGFGVDVGGTSYFNNDIDTDIQRLSEVTDVTSERQQSTWTSKAMTNGLQLTQVAAVPVNDQRLDVTVTLTNTSDAALEDVYYARQVDNDANVYACREYNGGGWSSLNTVEAQASTSDGLSLVSSIMMDDCSNGAPTKLTAPHSYLGMISTDPTSVAALQYRNVGSYGFGPQRASDFVTGKQESECISDDRCMNVNVTPGARVFGDSGIGLGFNLGTISAGSTKMVTFSYILSPDQAQNIIDEHNTDNGITPPAIAGTNLSQTAVVNSPFSLSAGSWLSSTGGDVAYYTISPALPSGLSLNSATGDITGTPTESSSSTEHTITAHNLAGMSSASISLTVIDGPTLTIEHGSLIGQWPVESSATYANYEYEVSTDGGQIWIPGAEISNTDSDVLRVPIIATIGYTYQIRVRGIGSQTNGEWVESAPLYYGLQDCAGANARVNVLLLSAPAGEGVVGTDPSGSDQAIHDALCQSEFLKVTVFNGRSTSNPLLDSEDAWIEALGIQDVLVLPVTNMGELFDSNLMSAGALTRLRAWVFNGGRVVFTGSASYGSQIKELVSNESESESVVTAVPEATVGTRREYSNTLLPIQLPTYGLAGIVPYSSGLRDFVNHYSDGGVWNSASQALEISFGFGQVFALSNDFSQTEDSWNTVLKHAVYSGLNQSIVVQGAGGIVWFQEGGALTNTTVNSYGSGMVRLGNRFEPVSVGCPNSPKNPMTLTSSTQGATLTCGSVTIDDGRVQGAVTATVSRFFSYQAPWARTSVTVENFDKRDSYDNEVWYGGDLGLGQDPLLEAEGQQITSSEMQNPHSRVVVASSGQAISNEFGHSNYPMIAQIYGQSPTRTFGGAELDGDPAFSRNQLWTQTDFQTSPLSSETFTWLEGYLSFDSGCDRLASANAWNRASSFLQDSESENNLGGIKPNNQLEYPNLSNIACESFGNSATYVYPNESNNRVALNWTRAPGATKYEISYRIVGSNSWTSPVQVEAEDSEHESHEFANLTPGIEYEFRIRPVQENRTVANDVAKGAWTVSSPITVSAAPEPSQSPSGSPAPSSSPSQSGSPQPTNEVAQVPSQIVPQMIAQTGPGFPVRLKKGKTVKFGMTALSGLPLHVSSVGQCKTTAITKKVTVKVLVGKKIKKKKVKMQSGWAVKGSKKGPCTVTFSNSGDATRSPLAVSGIITIF